MSRDTRVNLIVLAVLVLAMAPGAVILFKKKIDPTARPMNRPDFARRHMVFIDPTPAPASVPRLMPALTASWVNDLSRQRTGERMMTLAPPDGQDEADFSTADPDATRLPTPVMSEKRLAQVVSAHEYADGTVDVALLIWNLPRGTRGAKLTVHAATADEATGSAPGGSPEARISSSELLTVPAAVKRDLQMSGLPAPPQQALWAVARVELAPGDAAAAAPTAPRGGPLSLTIVCEADGAIFTDVAQVALPSASAIRSNHSTSR